jgi:hypothetical protein
VWRAGAVEFVHRLFDASLHTRAVDPVIFIRTALVIPAKAGTVSLAFSLDQTLSPLASYFSLKGCKEK